MQYIEKNTVILEFIEGSHTALQKNQDESLAFSINFILPFGSYRDNSIE